MGAWRRPGLIDDFRRRLIDGMRPRGLSAEYAEAVFQQIRGFGDYGFPESHAASFALLVYVSAWLKCHYPAAFTAALLNSQPMGFYAPAQLVRDARQHGVEVAAGGRECQPSGIARWKDADCEASNVGPSPRVATRGLGPGTGRQAAVCTLHIRLGFRLLAGDGKRMPSGSWQPAATGRSARSRILPGARASAGRPWPGWPRRGAFGSLAQRSPRGPVARPGPGPLRLPLFDRLEAPARASACAAANVGRGRVLADYRTAGLSLSAHPLQFLRGELDGWA